MLSAKETSLINFRSRIVQTICQYHPSALFTASFKWKSRNVTLRAVHYQDVSRSKKRTGIDRGIVRRLSRAMIWFISVGARDKTRDEEMEKDGNGYSCRLACIITRKLSVRIKELHFWQHFTNVTLSADRERCWYLRH